MTNLVHGTVIIVPTYNEEENIIPLLDGIFSQVPEVHILFVDDNSQDRTRPLIREYAQKKNGQIFLLERPGKNGLGVAYRAGFAWSLERSYERIIQMDADYSHDPKYLPQMIALLGDYDLVGGSRYVHGGGTRHWGMGRRILSRCGSLYAQIILTTWIKDFTGGFVGWRRSALQAIQLNEIKSNGYVFQIELKYRAKRKRLKFKEFPIIFVDRERGMSKMSGSIVKEAIQRVWALRFQVR